MTRTFWWAAAVAAVVIGSGVGAQRAPEPAAANFKKLVTIDTGAILFADISPDGKWLAIDVADGTIWMAPTDGHEKPFRLLEGNHLDRYPYWLPTSDGLTFTSNRPSRRDPRKFYGMVVKIDHATGRAVGVPHAITTDEVRVMGYASPDDRWAAYSTPSDSIKVVPITGGSAHGIARAPGTQGAVMWYRDGKTLVFNAGKGNWYRAPAAGGVSVPVRHAPFFGALHLHGDTANPIRHLELRDSTERVVSALDVPDGMTLKLFNYTTAAVGILDNDRFDTHVVTIADGSEQVIANTPWAYGWTPDGGHIGDASDARGPYVALYDDGNRIIKRVDLPADARKVDWDGTVGKVVTFRRGAGPISGGDYASPLYAVDAQTGTIRRLLDRAYEVSASQKVHVAGPGGALTDGDHFLVLVPRERGMELDAVGLDRRIERLRDFSSSETIYAIGVAGDRVAWAARAGDSMVVRAAKGLTGAAHRIATLPRDMQRPWADVAWSKSGDAVAINNRAERSVVAVVRMTADASPAGAPVYLATAGLPALWNMHWTSDDRALLLVSSPVAWVSSPSDAYTDEIVEVPADGSGPSRIISSHQGVEDDLLLSPDGKRVAFPHETVSGSSIWRIDFVPLKGRDTRL